MTSCCHPHQMPWSGATGAIARCKRVSTGCGRKSRSVRVLRWICGVKLKPKAVNKPLPYFIVHELDKPGSSATVSKYLPMLERLFKHRGEMYTVKIWPARLEDRLRIPRMSATQSRGRWFLPAFGDITFWNIS